MYSNLLCVHIYIYKIKERYNFVQTQHGRVAMPSMKKGCAKDKLSTYLFSFNSFVEVIFILFISKLFSLVKEVYSEISHVKTADSAPGVPRYCGIPVSDQLHLSLVKKNEKERCKYIT